MNDTLDNAIAVPVAAPLLRADEARVNCTWAGQNGDLTDTVQYDATDAQIKTWLTEAIRNGDIRGIQADPAVQLADFVVDRFPATDTVPYNRIMLRPKTAFGA